MISIIGCGWFGSALAKNLATSHKILGTTRTPTKLKELSDLGVQLFELSFPNLPAPELFGSDVIVLNIPPFEGQSEWFKQWPIRKQTHLIFISSTSVYGDRQLDATEEVTPDPDTIGGRILVSQEAWARTFEKHTIIRFGGLLGGDRHPGKFLSGRSGITHGKWPVNLIHQEDCVGFTRQCIEKNITGTFNLVSDEHRSRQEYYTEYCQKSGRALPEFSADDSDGKVVSNAKIKAVYQLKRPGL